jgi:CIC family chloride channel protein
VLELEVEPGAPFEGLQVRSLGLPPGCILVSFRDDVHESVPTAATVLQAHMRITAVVAPAARGGVAALRHGCEAAD